MRSKYLADVRNLFGVLKYGKVLFLLLLTLACFASSLHAGKPISSAIECSAMRGPESFTDSISTS